MQLKAENLSFRYGKKTPWILQNINFSVDTGEIVVLSGPSGYGKSTLGKILAGYLKPTRGQVILDGKPLPHKGYNPVQMIYQHPEQAVNPRWKLGRTLKEGWEPDSRLLKSMGIEEEWLGRWPLELSGGELQRFCIARVLGPSTRFLICDDVTTMLDSITQAQIWEQILAVAKDRNLGVVVITHNEELAGRLCGNSIHLPDLNAADVQGTLSPQNP